MNYACEYVTHAGCANTYCGLPATWRYPDDRGYLYFCDEHVSKHRYSVNFFSRDYVNGGVVK